MKKISTRIALIFILTFGILVIWSAYAPLDEGVPCQASVIYKTKRKPIQHLTGGIIKSIHITEGQKVKAGDVLISLDDEMSRARYEEVFERYIGNRAEESRLIAEQNHAQSINFHEDLGKEKNSPTLK